MSDEVGGLSQFKIFILCMDLFYNTQKTSPSALAKFSEVIKACLLSKFSFMDQIKSII